MYSNKNSMATLNFERRDSVPTSNPYNRSTNLKTAVSNPDRMRPTPRQSHDTDPKRESIFFEKYACLCPGTVSLEVTLRSGIISPRQSIDLDFDLSKAYRNI